MDQKESISVTCIIFEITIVMVFSLQLICGCNLDSSTAKYQISISNIIIDNQSGRMTSGKITRRIVHNVSVK